MGAPSIKTRSEGPRLESRNLSDSAYGAGIAIGFGTNRLPGQIIWAKEIEEEKVTTTTKQGGKGGGSVKNTNVSYNYFLTCAIAFAEGEAKQLMQLWADGKLIYSQKTGTGQGIKSGLNFRFYRGTEEQLPDPAIEADRGDAPAHRGLVYLVIERLPLQDFGNRPPSFTAEIAFDDPTDEADFLEITTLDMSSYGGFSTDNGTYDWERDRFYCKTDDDSGIYIVQLSTLELIGKLPLFDLHGVSQVSGKLVGRSGNDEVLVNPVTGGFESVNTGNNGTTENIGYQGNMLSLQADDGLYEIFISRYHFGFGGTFAARWKTHSVPSMTYRETLTGTGAGGYIKFSAARPGSGLGYYGLINSTTSAPVYRLQVTKNPTQGAPGLFGGTGTLPGPAGLQRTLIRTLTPSFVKAGATSFTWYAPDGWRAVCDPVSEGYLIWIHTNLGQHVIKLDRDGNKLWVTDIPATMIPAFGNAIYDNGDRIGGDSWAFISNAGGDHLLKINVATGEIDSHFDGTHDYGVDPFTSDGTYVWDDAKNCFFARRGDNYQRIQVGPRDSVSSSVASIITNLSERVGLELGTDFDVSDLTGSVEGFVIDNTVTVKSALEPLSKLFFFDPVERDGKIFYRERGDSPTVTISEQVFIQKTNDRPEQYEELIKQELELPATVTIGFLDPDLNYDPGSVSFKRIQGPESTVQSYQKENIEAGAALSYSVAKGMAEKVAFTRWMERSEYDFRIPWTYLRLEPADVITLQLDSGFTFRARFGDLDIGGDFSLDGTTTRENAGQYISTAVSDGASGNNGGIPVIGPTQLFLIDVPLLLDSDALDTSSRSYWMGASYTPGSWPGAMLNRSPDGAAYTEVNQLVDDAAWGVTSEALGDPASPWRTDTENTIIVTMVVGGDDLTNVTEEELVNGANAALLLKFDGTVECVQFQTVTSLGDNSYELSGLLRGRRGTDTMCYDHTANETFLLLTDASLGRFATSNSNLNADFYFKAVTFGQTFDQTLATTFAYSGRDLMPYAPVNVTAVNTGGGTLDIDWVRRTRIAGGLADGTGDVPLSETTELYDLVVYTNNTFTTVARTVSDLTTPTYTYSNADRVTDGTTGTHVYLRIYQKSSIVGRGFTHDWTVEIT